MVLEKTNQYEQYHAWKSAKEKASMKLTKHAESTGVAILGKVPSALDNDPKFQGQIKADAMSTWLCRPLQLNT